MDKLAAALFELTDLYGIAILEDPERISQFLEEKLPECGNEAFHLAFAVRFFTRNGWRVKSAASKLTELDEANLCAKLGFSETEAKDVIHLINETIDHTFGKCENITASRGTLQEIHGGIANRPRPMLINKKSVYNGLLLVAALFIVCLIFAQISEQRQPVGDELRIAFFASFSGADGAKAQAELHAAQLAVETINEAPVHRDGYKLRVVGLDVPKGKATEFIKETMQDKSYLAMMLGVGINNIKEAAAAADDVEAPLVIVSDRPFDEDEIIFDHIPSLYTFSLTHSISARTQMAGYFATQALTKKNAAIYYDISDRTSSSAAASVSRWCKRFGIKITADLSFSNKNYSHTAAAQAVSASGAELLILPSVGAEAADIASDVRKTSPQLTILSEHSSAGDWMINEVSELDPAVISVLKSYKRFYNEDCDHQHVEAAILAYDGVKWLANAFENAPGFHGEAIRHALLATKNLPLTHATLTIDPRTHMPMNKAFALVSYSRGKFIFQRRIRISK